MIFVSKQIFSELFPEAHLLHLLQGTEYVTTPIALKSECKFAIEMSCIIIHNAEF